MAPLSSSSSDSLSSPSSTLFTGLRALCRALPGPLLPSLTEPLRAKESDGFVVVSFLSGSISWCQIAATVCFCLALKVDASVCLAGWLTKSVSDERKSPRPKRKEQAKEEKKRRTLVLMKEKKEKRKWVAFAIKGR